MEKTVQKLPSVEWYKEKYPISPELAALKSQFDEVIKQNLRTKDRFVIVLGPCAADNIDAMRQYFIRIKAVADTVKDKILIVGRVFTAKPRTDGRGYLGLAFHDNEDGEIDFAAGIAKCREVMLMLLQLGIPVADELLYPELSEYFADLVSWQFLGARSSLDPLHRAVASGVDVAVGVKNSIDGDLLAVVKSVLAVSSSNNYIQNGVQLCTNGNKYSHVVLRGFHDGRNFRKNCNRESVDEVKRLLAEYRLDTNFVMVDCSHANSGKVAASQMQNALDAVGITGVDGIMLESYLYSGTAKDTFGVSKTDECLSVDDTEKLIRDIYNKLK